MAERIVSLVPSHTQTLHDLGLADRVVGRTRFCVHPTPWVDTIPVVGGTKDARLEKILAARPDLVVADKDENPKTLVESIEAAGVRVLWSDIATVADAAAFVARLGAEAGAREAGATWRDTILAATSTPRRDPVPVFCPIWYAPWMTFDRTSYCSAMLDAVGIRNVFANHAGPKYFEVEARDVATSEAQWTLLPSEPYPFHQRRAVVATADLGRCGTPERVRLIDGEALTWFGTRTAQGLRALAETANSLAN